VSGDLFPSLGAAPAPEGAAKMTREEIFARFGIVDLKSPRAHRCFRCEASTGLAHGDPRRGVVFACKAHIGEL
jgi:hypothetical protein